VARRADALPFEGLGLDQVISPALPPNLPPFVRFAALQSIDMQRVCSFYRVSYARHVLAVSDGKCGTRPSAVPRSLAKTGSSSRELRASRTFSSS
jgi:hypothetical protein